MRRPWLAGLAASLVIHGLVGVLTVWQFAGQGVPLADPVSARSGASRAGGVAPPVWPRRSGEPAEAQAPTIAEIIERQERVAAELPAERRLAELRRRLAGLRQIPPDRVDRIARLVERIKQVRSDRAYAPRPGRADPLQFDTESACLYDIARRRDGQRNVLVFTLVDKDGRSLSYTVEEREASAGDLLAWQVFELARDNPRLRRLVDSARRIIQTRIDRSADRRDSR